MPQPSLKLLLTIRFLNALANFLLMSLLTLLFLAAPFDFTTSQTATLMTIFAACSHGLEWLCSAIVPKWGRRNALTWGSSVCGFCLALVWAVPNFYVVAVVLMVFGIFFSIASLSIRLFVAGIPDETERQRAFGKQYWVLNVAAGLGPLTGFGIDYKAQPFLIFAGATLLFAISALLAVFFVPKTGGEKSAARFSLLPDKIPTDEIRKALPYYALLASLVYALFQGAILPFYFKTFASVPKEMGVILALNPVIIVCTQGLFSALSVRLEKKFENATFILGFAFALASFLPPAYAANSVTLALHIVLITIGEMLICANIDFAITRHADPSAHAVLLSLTGLMIALGRALAEGFGIWGLSELHHADYSPVLWWRGHVVIFVVLFVALTRRWWRRPPKSNMATLQTHVGG